MSWTGDYSLNWTIRRASAAGLILVVMCMSTFATYFVV